MSCVTDCSASLPDELLIEKRRTHSLRLGDVGTILLRSAGITKTLPIHTGVP